MKKILLILIVLFVIIGVILASNPGQDLQKGIEKKDAKAVKKAVDELVKQNDEKAYNELIKCLNSLGESPDHDMYMTILTGIARLTEASVVSKIASFIIANKNKNVGKDLLSAIKSNRSVSAVPLLSVILKKGDYLMQLEAIHQLGSIYAKESIEALIDYLKRLKNEEKELIKSATKALECLTSIKDVRDRDWWIEWWEKNKNKSPGELVKPKGGAAQIESVRDYRDMKGIETLPQEKVLVVRNDRCDNHYQGDRNYDKIQEVLEKLGIPHTVVGKSQIEDDSFDWDDKWAMIFNCNFFEDLCCGKECGPGDSVIGARTRGCVKSGVAGYDHMTHNTKLSDKTIKKITRFVETGGYLFTEDLNIREIVVRAFKGIVTDTKEIEDRTVKIMPAPGAALHPYLKYVFEAPPSSEPEISSDGSTGETRSVKPGEYRADAEWKIDNGSPDIKVLKPDIVTILIISPELRKVKKGKVEDEGAVAVTWGYSAQGVVISGDKANPYVSPPGGRVLHVMSHFGKQRSKLDEFALQNLILNFLIELNERRPRAGKPK
jgi:hypothetical protein